MHVDPLYSSQQGYLEYINVHTAWANYGKGNSSHVIAIVDSGRFASLGELTNYWINTIDVAPGDGIDNDNDGYIDNFNGGWNTVNNSNNIDDAGSYNSGGNYYFSHGSAVWATAGAPENNYGIEGVAPRNRIVLIKAGQMVGNQVYFYLDALISAMDYLYAHSNIRNVDIRIQIASYGGNGYSSIFESAINDAIGERTLFVASAGNYNSNVESYPVYPCKFNLNNKLCVGAVNLDGSRSSYSNFGISVDLTAPGSVVVPVKMSGGSEVYAWASGTSFSAPLVGGAAALVFSAKPSLTPFQVAACIKSTTFTTGHQLNTATNGVLNTDAAIAKCMSSTPIPVTAPPHATGSGSIVTFCLAFLLQ